MEDRRKKTYLFYDIETTGLNKCFDQVVQFAAIRTDEKLNELERHEIQIRLNPDVVPSPSAITTHHIGINEMLSGKPEIEAILEIHQLINTPGTISVGYNTLGFDDEFLRFSFYRNMLPPYTHQFENECGRMDLYPITALYYLFKPEVLHWPQPLNLKLENLSQQNQLAEGRAHQAMVDVSACLTLARKFINHQKLWNFAIGCFNKKMDENRFLQLPINIEHTNAHREGLLIQGNFGCDLNYQIPSISLGQHRHYKNQYLWLRLDCENLSTLTEKNIPETPYVIRKRMGEPPFILPLSQPYLKQLCSQRLALAKENKRWLQKNPHLFQAICDYYLNFTYPQVPNLDSDAALYQMGLPTSYEKFLFQRFHLSPLKEKEKIALTFPNPVHRQQAIRVMGRHYSDYLSEKSKKEFDNYLKNIESHDHNSCDYRGKHRLTRKAALKKIDELKAEGQLDTVQLKLLEELSIYLSSN